MRVIAGSVRGRRLETPKNNSIRPTQDRVREALFNILQSRLDGARFLDLFAGTGAMGIEALSRGATHATFVESDSTGVALIQRNLAMTGFEASARIMHHTLPQAFMKMEGRYDLIYADPPYGYTGFSELLPAMAESNAACPGAAIVIEHHERATLDDSYPPFNRHRTAKYGTTILSFYT